MENEIKTPEGGILISMPIDQEVKKAYIDYPRRSRWVKACT